METLLPLSAALRARGKRVEFVFRSNVDSMGYAIIEHDGERKILHVGHSVLRAKLIKWVHAGNAVQGSMCEIRWNDRHPEFTFRACQQEMQSGN